MFAEVQRFSGRFWKVPAEGMVVNLEDKLPINWRNRMPTMIAQEGRGYCIEYDVQRMEVRNCCLPCATAIGIEEGF